MDAGACEPAGKEKDGKGVHGEWWSDSLPIVDYRGATLDKVIASSSCVIQDVTPDCFYGLI